MKYKNIISVMLVGALLLFSSGQFMAARAETADQSFANGEALLAKADFDGSLQAFARAARADRNNPNYLQRYTMLNRIVELRKRLAIERDPAQWDYIARGLHAFYVDHGLYAEALTVDRKLHQRLNTAYTAALLVETCLALNRTPEASRVLTALPPEKQTPETRALYGLALARQGQMDEARMIAGSIPLSSGTKPEVLYVAARLNALLGNTDEAICLLKYCFRSIAPSRLEGFKKRVQQAPEFTDMTSASIFKQALQTQSKVAESKCSGGSSCSGCPMRGECGNGIGS